MSRLALLLLQTLAVAWVGQALDEEVDAALFQDDQCVSHEDGECVLNALQMMSQKSFDELETDAEEEEDEELESGWLKDISVKIKNKFKKELSPLQKPIVAEYQALAALDKFANYSMEKTENATGQQILWNKKGTDLLQLNDAVAHGRRRSSKSLPPRARYVNKILIYLEKEMQAVWNLHTIVDRKRWGVGNVITSSPYGPHGEHPDDWEPNGSFPMPLVKPPAGSSANITLPKAKTAEYDNKYAEQLQEDYEALVKNIIDANTKTLELKEALIKMDGFADQFISEPSGEFNKIDTQ